MKGSHPNDCSERFRLKQKIRNDTKEDTIQWIVQRSGRKEEVTRLGGTILK